MNDKISSEEEFATGGVIPAGGPLFVAPLSTGCDIPYGNAALVLKPGERLVISLPPDVDGDLAQQFARHMRSQLGDQVFVIAGADQIAVLPPTSTDEENHK